VEVILFLIGGMPSVRPAQWSGVSGQSHLHSRERVITRQQAAEARSAPSNFMPNAHERIRLQESFAPSKARLANDEIVPGRYEVSKAIRDRSHKAQQRSEKRSDTTIDVDAFVLPEQSTILSAAKLSVPEGKVDSNPTA